ncbi:unnamed protein product [Caenorhabditis angaria]|uniref:C-type lectin domain-containing protein n=1 Tax=Caenorhabditis angaria TaxID=860376 RepID=A0A9P1MYM9_9PELO|nr:unnamed protein product [Caenorhabditis angaria]
MRPAYGSVFLGNAGLLCLTLDSSAVLSGFQNLAELSAMSSEVAAYDSSIIYMAVGAIRSDNCKTQASLSTAACSQTNIFVWSDGHTTGSAGFDWYVNTPNGCFNTGCDIANWAIVYPSLAKMDDFPANWAVGGSICGMEATYS